jgi:hypothetical protein
MSALAPFATENGVPKRREGPKLPAHGKKMLTYEAKQRLGTGGNDEAARIYRAYGRGCVAVRCNGAASGADLSRWGLVQFQWSTQFFATSCRDV